MKKPNVNNVFAELSDEALLLAFFGTSGTCCEADDKVVDALETELRKRHIWLFREPVFDSFDDDCLKFMEESANSAIRHLAHLVGLILDELTSRTLARAANDKKPITAAAVPSRKKAEA
jgi:hypothetical protein